MSGNIDDQFYIAIIIKMEGLYFCRKDHPQGFVEIFVLPVSEEYMFLEPNIQLFYKI
jgi:hypothetical protein